MSISRQLSDLNSKISQFNILVAGVSATEWEEQKVNRDKSGKFAKKNESDHSSQDNGDKSKQDEAIVLVKDRVRRTIETLIPGVKVNTNKVDEIDNKDFAKEEDVKNIAESFVNKLIELDANNVPFRVAEYMLGALTAGMIYKLKLKHAKQEKKFVDDIYDNVVRKSIKNLTKNNLIDKQIAADVSRLNKDELAKYRDSVIEHVEKSNIATLADKLLDKIHSKLPKRPLPPDPSASAFRQKKYKKENRRNFRVYAEEAQGMVTDILDKFGVKKEDLKNYKYAEYETKRNFEYDYEYYYDYEYKYYLVNRDKT